MCLIAIESLPCEGCKGLCCGPVPVTEQELKKIKKKIRSMPRMKREQLEKQTRFFGTCIFYDSIHNQCGIYSARPKVCQLFGHHRDLVCFRKPELATGEKVNVKENPVGILSVDIAWKDFI